MLNMTSANNSSSVSFPSWDIKEKGLQIGKYTYWRILARQHAVKMAKWIPGPQLLSMVPKETLGWWM